MQPSIRLMRIAGVDIGIHYTWIFAFLLITWTLAAAFFPFQYPGWATATYWATGALAAVLLFASVLVHEMAHAMVALAKGLPVRGITLFIFGGVTNIEGEAEKARDEFAIAIVGPLTSFALAAVFWLIWTVLPDPDNPTGATAFYLALINFLLGAFNLMPGFPLDGGRVLRSILWGTTRSLNKATNIASMVGQVFGWLLIGWGIFSLLAGNIIGGIWIALIGWFLSVAAEATRRDANMRQIFRGVRVRDVMQGEPETVEPDATLESIVREHFLRRGLRALPVCEGHTLAGIISLTDVKDVPQERWPHTRVGQVMTRDPLHKVRPTDDVTVALNQMNEHSIHQSLVTEDGDQLVGMLNRAHVIRYLQGMEELGIARKEAMDSAAEARR